MNNCFFTNHKSKVNKTKSRSCDHDHDKFVKTTGKWRFFRDQSGGILRDQRYVLPCNFSAILFDQRGQSLHVLRGSFRVHILAIVFDSLLILFDQRGCTFLNQRGHALL